MPSLRRSFSSPSVRSSPYPPSTNSSSIRTRSTPLHPRRSPPSATAERRVLADIEWWRVHDGQCDLDHAQEDTHEPPGGLVTLSAGGGSFELLPHSLSLDSMQGAYPNALVALSIAPCSPPGSRYGRDSSVESTPELPTASLETVQLDSAGSGSCPYNDLFSLSPLLTRVGGRQVYPVFGLRSVSAPNLSRQHTLAPDFADMGGDSFSLDQNLFQ